jgi:hypothetical protein
MTPERIQELKTPIREQQIKLLQERLEKWYWKCVEASPFMVDGDSHSIQFEMGMSTYVRLVIHNKGMNDVDPFEDPV